MTPNDPKLSDGGGWRGPCMAGGKAAAEARAVTAVAVRCSAWLGDGWIGMSVMSLNLWGCRKHISGLWVITVICGFATDTVDDRHANIV